MCHQQEPMSSHYIVWGFMDEYVVKWLSQTNSCFLLPLLLILVRIFSGQFSVINCSCPAIPGSTLTGPSSLSELLPPLFSCPHPPSHHPAMLVARKILHHISSWGAAGTWWRQSLFFRVLPSCRSAMLWGVNLNSRGFGPHKCTC